MTSLEPATRSVGVSRRRWPARLTVAGALVVLAGVVGQLNQLDGHGHWLVIDDALGNPLWLAATALLLFAAAVFLGMRRRPWWRVAARAAAAMLLLVLAAVSCDLGYLDHTWYGYGYGLREVQQTEAPGGPALRVIIERNTYPAIYWKVNVESGHGLLRQRWEAACSLKSSGGTTLTDVTWTGPRQIRITTDGSDTLTLIVNRTGRRTSLIPADFAC